MPEENYRKIKYDSKGTVYDIEIKIKVDIIKLDKTFANGKTHRKYKNLFLYDLKKFFVFEKEIFILIRPIIEQP